MRSHFGINSNPRNEKIFNKSNSLWEPKEVHHTVKTFIEDFTQQVNNSLQEQTNDKKQYKNLNKNEDGALKDLMERTDIIICNADKGGAVVIMDVKDYIQEAERQLSDENFYKKLPTDATSLHVELVNNAIEQLKNRNLISEKIANGLKVSNPRTPLFYLLPKIHKENNPGRPVVSSINCHTESISQFVDYHLQPLAKQLPSYVQDTTDFLRKLNDLPKHLPKGATLVTMDVKSLYTNIPNVEGIEAVKSYLRESDRKLTQVISAFLTLILTLNNFQFNDQNILQINGVSMGTKCAPTYATLYMGKFEENYILPVIREAILLYCRFIDDIFFIWTKTEDELVRVIDELNSIHPTIKFDVQFSKENINFLDTTVTITKDNTIKTTVYTKPTDQKSYLHAKSYHPKSTRDAIPYSQALRIKRICTDVNDYKSGCDKLLNELVKRGYKMDVTIKSIEKANNMRREDLLKYKEKSTNNKVPIIVTYNKQLPKIQQIVDNTWNTLKINPEEAIKFEEKPLLCFRRNQNLKDLIGQTRISKGKVMKRKKNKIGKCSPCLSRRDTKCCKHVASTSTFKNENQSGSKVYNIYHNVTCKSKNVIYFAQCRRCNNKPYVGKCEDQAMHKRITTHRYDAKNPNSIPVDRHFLLPNHNFDHDFKLTIIEQVTKPNMTKEQIRELLLSREDFWTLKLNTLHPHGFNEKLNYPNF